MGLEREIRLLGGAVRWQRLLDMGVRAAEVRTAVAHGLLVQPSRGVYAVPGVSPDVLAAVTHRGLLTCSSAATHYGLAVLNRPVAPHLRGNRLAGRGVGYVSHWCRARCPPPASGPPVVEPVVAVRDAARCLPFPEALVIADSALHQRLVGVADLRTRSRGPHAGALARLGELADGRAESLLETLARLAFLEHGWAVRTQVHYTGVGWVDVLVEGRVVVELDGDEFHTGPDAVRRDRSRDTELAIRGLRVLRFGYDDVVFGMDRVIAAVRAALAAAG